MTPNNGTAPQDFKNGLRRKMRAQRTALTTTERNHHDTAIRDHLSHLIEDRQCRSIAAFWPFNGEPDITPLFKPLMDGGCELALPVVSGGDDHCMQFHAWQTNDELPRNRYGIPEPVDGEQVSVANLDLLIMPLVAYDLAGNRLGMGAGYYDRHLESLRDQVAPLRVGVAYRLQEVPELDSNHWDVMLHGIVNERGWYTFTTLE